MSILINNINSAESTYREATDPNTLLGRAYSLWSGSEVNCKCAFHLNKQYDHKPNLYPSESKDFPICNRQKYWELYCHVRDGKILTDGDKMLLGMA